MSDLLKWAEMAPESSEADMQLSKLQQRRQAANE